MRFLVADSGIDSFWRLKFSLAKEAGKERLEKSPGLSWSPELRERLLRTSAHDLAKRLFSLKTGLSKEGLAELWEAFSEHVDREHGEGA